MALKGQMVFGGVVLLASYASAISYCYKYAPMGGYQFDMESGPPAVDKDCHQVTADLEAESAAAEMPILGRQTPRCMENGHFDLYQCHGSECYCTDCAGLKIEGYDNFGRHEADASKCSCAREQHEFGRSGMVGVSHRCEPHGGHYKSYQCQGTGCYCTDKFGKYIQTDDEGARFTPWAAAGKDEFCASLS